MPRIYMQQLKQLMVDPPHPSQTKTNFCKNQQIDPKSADNVSKRGFDLQSKNILKNFHNGTFWQRYIY